MTIIATEFTAYANAQTTDEAVYAIKFSTRIIAIGEFRTINTSVLQLSLRLEEPTFVTIVFFTDFCTRLDESSIRGTRYIIYTYGVVSFGATST